MGRFRSVDGSGHGLEHKEIKKSPDLGSAKWNIERFCENDRLGSNKI